MLAAGGTAPALFNAANEVAVNAFLARDLAFSRITEVIDAALERLAVRPVRSLADVLEADRAARAAARETIARAIMRTA